MKKVLLVAGVALISAAAGAVAGYHFAVRRLNDEYNEVMEAEIERTRAYYESKKKYPTPQDAVKDLIKEDAAKAAVDETEVSSKDLERIVKKLKYNAVQDGVAPEMEPDPRMNVFRKGSSGEDETFEAEVAGRDKSKPYIISDRENHENPDEYDQLTLTWYRGDKVLADAKDEEYDLAYLGGEENLNFGHRSNDPNVVYIRSDKLKAIFEVLLSTGKYSVEVQGLDG